MRKDKTTTSNAFNVGDGLQIECNTYGWAKWYFKKPDSNPDVYLVSTNHILKIDPLHNIHAGTYYCYGYTTEMGNFLSEHHLMVYGKSF